ncbi:hypothetical protein Uis1B_1943 [Bifidobacterium margollesii]|uniref:Uncharacterized protein n=1 Tax=Bifidobacterium margollesii TaxID=2020964 RepID=A0A2N5J7T8_9BIFI|nr:hypothetical protein [Bifidobacterium margollesii]PLS30273.1 hypothetical protein Uis1B_1943 [Bifidobacterium margollesii]
MLPINEQIRAYDELMDDVTGYIVGYWEDAAAGRPYHAIHHPGHTARDMASDYMTERYRDWLEGMQEEDPAKFARYAALGEGDDPVGAAMDACDRMFDRIWPRTTGDDPNR